jgi:hypothetical protein
VVPLGSKDAALQLRGALIIELAELDAIVVRKQAESKPSLVVPQIASGHLMGGM